MTTTRKMVRCPFGHLTADGRWFLERGAYIEGPRGGVSRDHNLWLIWERIDSPTGESFEQTQAKEWEGQNPLRGLCDHTLRPMWELTGDDRHAGKTTPYRHEYDAGSYDEARGLVARIEREGSA